MKTACGLPNVAWVGASLFAAFSVAACSGTTEPQLGFGQNSGGGVGTWFEAGREQSFGSLIACNKSPEKYKIVITGISLNEPTNGLKLVDWGWNPNTFKPRPIGGTFLASSPQTLQELGFSPFGVSSSCSSGALSVAKCRMTWEVSPRDRPSRGGSDDQDRATASAGRPAHPRGAPGRPAREGVGVGQLVGDPARALRRHSASLATTGSALRAPAAE